jgi:hypothetical protein
MRPIWVTVIAAHGPGWQELTWLGAAHVARHRLSEAESMRRVFGPWIMAALLALALLPGVAGAMIQESTPAEGASGGNVTDPELGDLVAYISESGSPIAELRSTEVDLDWDEYSEYYVSKTGFSYVAVVVEITNLGSRGSLVVRADDFRLQDVDGFYYTRSWADAAEDAELVPAEGEVAIRSGDTEEIVLVYEVLEGIELSNLFWQPEYERLLTVVDLSGSYAGED